MRLSEYHRHPAQFAADDDGPTWMTTLFRNHEYHRNPGDEIRPVSLNRRRLISAALIGGAFLGGVLFGGNVAMRHTRPWTKVFANGAYLGLVPNNKNVVNAVRSTAIGYHVNVSLEPVHKQVQHGYVWQGIPSLPTSAVAIEVNQKPVVYTSSFGDAKQILHSLRAALMPRVVSRSATIAFTKPIQLSSTTVAIADILSPSEAVDRILHPMPTELAGRSGGMEAIVGLSSLKVSGARRVLSAQSATVAHATSRSASGIGAAEVTAHPRLATASDKPLISLKVTEQVARTTTVAPETTYVKDASLPVGDQKVLKPGKTGRAKERISLVFLNGKLQSTVVDSRRIISPPTPEVVEEGSNDGVASGSWIWPSPDTEITSGFGWRILNGVRNFHPGIDIACPVGTPVYAANNGVVEDAGWNNGGYGNWVVLNNGNGFESVYGHMSAVAVAAGATVSKGQVIGYSGATGFATGPHLHYEVRINGTAVDPTPYM